MKDELDQVALFDTALAELDQPQRAKLYDLLKVQFALSAAPAQYVGPPLRSGYYDPAISGFSPFPPRSVTYFYG